MWVYLIFLWSIRYSWSKLRFTLYQMAGMDWVNFLRTRRWYVLCPWFCRFNSLMATQGILQMRLYALYSLDKRVVVLMLTSFTLALTISGYILFVLSKPMRMLYHRIIHNYSLNPNSGGSRFAIRWNVLLSFASHSNTLLVLDTVDGFWVPTLWPCGVQRFADSETQWVT